MGIVHKVQTRVLFVVLLEDVQYSTDHEGVARPLFPPVCPEGLDHVKCLKVQFKLDFYTWELKKLIEN